MFDPEDEMAEWAAEMDEWAAQVEARHNFPDSGDELNAGGFPW